MPDTASEFRNYGLLADNLQPPTGTVRAELSGARVVGQYLGGAFLVAIANSILIPVLWFMPSPVKEVSVTATLCTLAAYLYLACRNDYCWIELDGNTIRAKHLYTGRILERNVQEIERLSTLAAPNTSALEVAVTNALLGRVRGVEIRFRDKRTPLKVMRADPKMTNALELIQAILYRMSQLREIVPEVVDHGGLPLVRNIHWVGDDPGLKPVTPVNVILACLIGLALMLGLVFVAAGLQAKDKLDVASVRPHELSITDLIKDGPGENRHVTLVNYIPGGSVMEMPSGSKAKDGNWRDVWTALFPPNQMQEIKVVMSSKSIRDEATLDAILKQGKITGICSKGPRRGWGATLGPDLVKYNNGAKLEAAYEIEYLAAPPSESAIKAQLWSGYAGLGITIALCLAVFARGVFGLG